jgi:NTP pyrophosphatase (non-canonical NTP hydrolase)
MTIDPGYHRTLAKDDPSLFTLTVELRSFVGERKWRKGFPPRQLVSGLVLKAAGVLATIYDADSVSADLAGDRDVAEGLADVLMYVIRLADLAGVDLVHEIWHRLEANAAQRNSAQRRAGSLGPAWAPDHVSTVDTLDRTERQESK